jgi:Ca2+/Na+ antiporter
MLLLAIWEGWKARNVSTEFQESKDIVSALKSILIVIVICVPVLYSAKDLPNTILFVECAMVFFICFLLLGFTFVPKYIYQRKEHKEKANNASSSRYNNNTISVTATGTSRPSEYDGDQILSNKSRNELIAEVQELRTLLQLQQPASKKDVTATTGGEEGFFPSLKEKVMSELSNNGIIFKEEKKNWKKSTLQAQI